MLPEKQAKDVGLGLTLPLYQSGPELGGLVGHVHHHARRHDRVRRPGVRLLLLLDDPPDVPAGGQPSAGCVLACWSRSVCSSASWALTLLAARWNRADRTALFYAALGVAGLWRPAARRALLAGPRTTGMDPTAHVYPAIVWLLVGWTAIHVAAGVLMQLYCVARRAAGRMTARHDIDMSNVRLYWHFVALTVAATVAVMAGFPLIV